MEVYESEPLYLWGAPRLESQILLYWCDFAEIRETTIIEIQIYE